MSHETTPMFCDECHSAVRLERTETNSLKAVCACGETRDVKIAQAIPEEWSA